MEDILEKKTKSVKISEQLEELGDEILKIVNGYQSKLKQFDNDHFDAFISEKLGNKPIAPNSVGGIAGSILFPPYALKYAKDLKKYNAEMEEYETRFFPAKQEYFEFFKDLRQKIGAEDQKQLDEMTHDLELKYSELESERNKVDEWLDKYSELHPSLQDVDTINKLIGYVAIGRANTLETAINLFFDEERKKKEEARNEEFRQEMRDRQERLEEEIKELELREISDELRRIADDTRAIRDKADENYYDS